MKNGISRDRALSVSVDEHVRATLQFMQETIPTSKLSGVAEAIPQMARLLWNEHPQEPVTAISLKAELPIANSSGEKQLSAI